MQALEWLPFRSDLLSHLLLSIRHCWDHLARISWRSHLILLFPIYEPVSWKYAPVIWVCWELTGQETSNNSVAGIFRGWASPPLGYKGVDLSCTWSRLSCYLTLRKPIFSLATYLINEQNTWRIGSGLSKHLGYVFFRFTNYLWPYLRTLSNALWIYSGVALAWHTEHTLTHLNKHKVDAELGS
jgi:hypothetical protein